MSDEKENFLGKGKKVRKRKKKGDVKGSEKGAKKSE
jgi:hypothetical protein